MKIIGKIERQLYRDRFHGWVLMNRHLPLLRIYLGNKSRHYNLFLMLRAYDETSMTLDFTQTVIDEISQVLLANRLNYPYARETVYGLYKPENEFVMTNYLDRIGVRTHLILKGAGEYESNGVIIPYTKGDVLLVDDADYNNITKHRADEGTVHFVTCWSDSNAPRNWELFAQSQAKTTAWPSLQLPEKAA